jgi:hypothetical protein
VTFGLVLVATVVVVAGRFARGREVARSSGATTGGGAVVRGEECLTDLCFVVLLQLKLLKKAVGMSTHEGVSFGGEHRLDMAEALVQALEQVQHLAWLGDGVDDITEIVGQLLQLVAIVGDGEIALIEAVEFGLKEHRDKTELTKSKFDEASPLTIVGVKKIKKHRNMIMDVDCLNHSKGGRLRLVKEEVGLTGIRGGRRASRRESHVCARKEEQKREDRSDW